MEVQAGILGRLNHVLVGDYELGEGAKRYLSFGLLPLAVGIGSMSFTTSSWWFWTKDVSLRPDFLSGLFAILIIGSLYARKLSRLSLSVHALLSLVLNVTILAILVQGMLGATATFLTSWPMPWVLGATVVFTWVGIRPLVPWAWGLTVVLGMANLVSMSNAMGLWGYAMILSASLGLGLQLRPASGALRDEIALHFLGERQGIQA